jgi:hypothetical protein
MKKPCGVLWYLFLLIGPAVFLGASQARANQQLESPHSSRLAQQAHAVPVVDGGAGPCSLALTVTAVDGTPIYNATIKVHIAYGFAGFHRLDLQAGTNVDGKAKFTELPSRVHQPPLVFQASKNQLVGSVTFDPQEECQAAHYLVLDKPKAPENN